MTDTTISVTFNEAVFSNNDGSGALDSADFIFSLQGDSSILLSTTPKSISAIVNTYILGIDLSSTPDGEQITVKPAANAIYDAVGVRLRDHPMSPPKVLKAIDEASAKIAAE